VAEQRAHWHEQLAAESAARLVFVDESGANTKMTRLGGRALKKETLRDLMAENAGEVKGGGLYDQPTLRAARA
jgi:hypothetical protein